MADMLQEICEAKRHHVAKQKSIYSFADLDAMARSLSAPRPFAQALKNRVAEGGIGLICEIKKASPSAGLIRKDFDPVSLATTYEAAGATCLSVLTDEPYFQGHNEYLRLARTATHLPVLRKDFIVDLWQVVESRAIGADCILLIMAALSDPQVQELHEVAVNYRMDVIVEVHDETELKRALNLPNGFIGINNRNLKTLETDLAVTERLAPLVPPERSLICESGVKTAADVTRMRQAGVQCFLVGESLMRQSDVFIATQSLLKG
ncbi:MAG: indole-3-glycerol phosphate synthase TrpC [Bdellovibrionales bacterium]